MPNELSKYSSASPYMTLKQIQTLLHLRDRKSARNFVQRFNIRTVRLNARNILYVAKDVEAALQSVTDPMPVPRKPRRNNRMDAHLATLPMQRVDNQ